MHVATGGFPPRRNPISIRAANDVLKSQWKTASSAKRTPAMKRISSDLLGMADLIVIDGRHELLVETAKRIITGPGPITSSKERKDE